MANETPCVAPPSAPHASGSAAVRAPRGEAPPVPVIPSEQLLSGRQSVTIDHEGMHYVLRATRAGKLILTK